MTVRLIEGFDMFNGTGTGTGLQARWTANALAGSLVAGRFNGQALSVNPGNYNGTWGWFSRPTPAAYVSWTVGFALKIPTLTLMDDDRKAVVMYIGATVNGGSVSICARNDGTLFVCLGTPTGSNRLVVSAAGIVLSNTWQYIEVEFTASATVGVCKMYVSGAFVNTGAGTGLNTGTTSCQYFQPFGGSFSNLGGASTSIIIDDMYEVDAATRLGERRVETLRPASDSAVTWTPNTGSVNFSRVNEATVDGDTSFVQTGVVGNRDLYGIGPLSSAAATIDGVQLTGFAEKTDVSTRTVALTAKSGASDDIGADFSLAGAYACFNRIMTADPNGGGAWTFGGVNGLLVGPKLTN